MSYLDDWSNAERQFQDGEKALARFGQTGALSDQEAATEAYSKAVTFYAQVARDVGNALLASQISGLAARMSSANARENAMVARNDASTAIHGMSGRQALHRAGAQVMTPFGQWLAVKQPNTIQGLGANPTKIGGRWYAQSGSQTMTWTGLGDVNSDWSAGEAAFNQANTEMGSAQTAGDYQQAISDFMTAMNDYLAVMNDTGNTSGAATITNLISSAQTAQTTASGTTDSALASSQASLVQVNAGTARTLAQSVASSNKASPGNTPSPSVSPSSGGGGGGGTKTTPNTTPAPIATVTPTSSTNKWLPWAIGGGLVLGVGAIAYASHQRKKRRRA